MADRGSSNPPQLAFGRAAWLSTEEAGAQAGMSSQWVRRQIEAGRVHATVFRTGRRPTYRIRPADWRRFLEAWTRGTDAPDWEEFGLQAPPD